MEYNYSYSKDLVLPEMHRAAKGSERAKVRKLLKGGANPNETGNYNDTPLMWAAHGGNRGIVADLLEAGADVKAIDDNQSTPLLFAAERGRDEVITDLLAAGANVKAADMLGMTALHYAAFADSPECIAILVRGRANINCISADGYAPLHFAAFFGHPAAIRALVKGGADVKLADKADGHTALHFAAREGDDVSIRVLADYRINLDATNKMGNTAIHMAAHYGHNEVVDALIDCGAKVNLLNKMNQTPLLLAQRAGHANVADTLITADESIKPASPPKSNNTAGQVYDGAWRRIVFIESYGGIGSGVIIAPNLVATNFHVVEHGGIEVFKAEETEEGMPFRKTKERGIDRYIPYSADICAASRRQDFCLLNVDRLGGEEVKVRASHTLGVGEDVYAIGNPVGKDLTLSAGVISQLRNNSKDKCREIQTNAAISPGSSGGGLFDRDGNLVGITTRGELKEKGDPRVPQNLNFAIPADLIWGHWPALYKSKPATKGKKGGKR